MVTRANFQTQCRGHIFLKFLTPCSVINCILDMGLMLRLDNHFLIIFSCKFFTIQPLKPIEFQT